jgi:5-methylcytosine-specific restriction endonuclease McrA
MTKEEYEKLLMSDYWKGFSYSLIKERNFTCEDCGRTFYNQRNKLQVHHLVYRDINPWSYKPEEMVVLCEDCHKKRHGIISEPETESETTNTTTINEVSSFPNEDSFSTDSRNVNPNEMDYGTTYDRWGNRRNDRWERKGNYYGAYSRFPRRRWRLKLRYVLLAICCCLMFAVMYQSKKVNKEVATEMEKEEALIDNTSTHTKKSKKKSSVKTDTEYDDMVEVPEEELATEQEGGESAKELSTTELLERKTHESVVKQARRAGVSTEGSTSDILERITHADVVKQARRAGVSTEGSTSDILERITHADVVKQARRAGVSTEGSTSDILERITRKQLENY